MSVERAQTLQAAASLVFLVERDLYPLARCTRHKPMSDITNAARELGIDPYKPGSRRLQAKKDLCAALVRHAEQESNAPSPAIPTVPVLSNGLPSRILFRTTVFDLIQRGDLRIDPCHLDDGEINVTKIQSKKTDVTSILLFGEIARRGNFNREFVIKLSFESRHPDLDNSLAVERFVYTNVTNPLIFRGHTPHVIVGYETHECTQFLDQLESVAERGKAPTGPFEQSGQQSTMRKAAQNAERLLSASMKVDARRFDRQHAHFFMLERSRGKTLYDYIDSGHAWKEFWQPILFQLVYTLICFERVGLMHNDLHGNNILIDKFSAPVRAAYRVLNRRFVVESHYSVRIFDFDRASKQSTHVDSTRMNNTLLDRDFCRPIGQCNRFVPGRDLFTVLWMLKRIPRHVVGASEVIAFATDNAVVALLNMSGRTIGQLSWDGQPCICTSVKNKYCLQCTTPKVLTRPLEDIITGPFFDDYAQNTGEWPVDFEWTLPT